MVAVQQVNDEIPWLMPLLGLLVVGAGAAPLVLRQRRRARLPAASPSAPGLPKTVGRYEIRERLGVGAAAVVYSAWDPRLRREVNVKVLHTHLLGTEAEKRMRREARALANLQHGVIQAIVEIIDRPGQLALVVESVDAVPLDRHLAEKGRLPLTEALAIVRALASGLDHAHQRGVVHRDVKPGNILVGQEGRYYLVDFGLAAYYEAASLLALTHQGDLLGTPAYMSPEQIARGKTADHRSDVYSLGVVLYEMLTGQRPFDGDTPSATLMLQVNDEPPERPLEELPESVRSVVKRALQKAPGRRYQSAGALADALEEAIASEERYKQLVLHAEQVTVVHHVETVAAARDSARELSSLRFVGEEVVVEAALQIYALGKVRAIRDGNLVANWGRPMSKPEEVFYFILLHEPVERDVIGAEFWPGSSPRRMRVSLHTTLNRIRKALGSQDVVVIDGAGAYRVGVDYWFDVTELALSVEQARLLPLEDQTAQAHWERAVELYQGDLLPGAQGIWCVDRRTALREMCIEALIALAKCREVRSQFGEALGLWRRVLEVDRLREEAYRGIMQCYAAMGEQGNALAEFHRCAKILGDEMGVEPSRETVALRDQIVADTTPSVQPESSSAPSRHGDRVG